MIILPDYDNSILSTVASVMKAYGLPSGYPTLPVLDEMLAERPKNIVILLLDGLGVTTLEEVLPQESFLRRHHVHTVTSVVPSTTTAAASRVTMETALGTILKMPLLIFLRIFLIYNRN